MAFQKQTELHPLGFFLPENTRLLMLGSFPPPKARWSMEFYYPNIMNDMWRIFGIIFYADKNYFLAGKKVFSQEKAMMFCREYGIGLGDTAVEVYREKGNASDKYLEVITPFNPEEILYKIPKCKVIVITGQKAMDILLSVIPQAIEPQIGKCSDFILLNRTLKLYRMPSSSKAYPLPLEEKAAVYNQMFKDIGLI